MPLFVFWCGAHSGADIEQYSLRREGSEFLAGVRAAVRIRNGKYEVQGIDLESESDFFELGKSSQNTVQKLLSEQ